MNNIVTADKIKKHFFKTSAVPVKQSMTSYDVSGRLVRVVFVYYDLIQIIKCTVKPKLRLKKTNKKRG